MGVQEPYRDRVRRFARFAPDDHAGLGMRLLISSIDLLVIGIWLLVATLAVALASRVLPNGLWSGLLAIVWLAPIAYLTELRRHRSGSLGFLVTGYRVVSVGGDEPTLWTMIVRLAASLAFLLADLPYIGSDQPRRSLADAVAGTLVVRRDARPITYARRSDRLLFFLRSAVVITVPEEGRRQQPRS